MTENKAISKILDALETYKDNHNMRYGSITDDLLDALIDINKLNKENKKNKNTIKSLVEQRENYLKEHNEVMNLQSVNYLTEISVLKKELEKRIPNEKGKVPNGN